MKQKLYIDFDNTLVDTTKAIVSLYNNDFKYYKDFVQINPEDIDTWDFEECTCANRMYINSYFNQPRFFGRLSPFPDALKAISNLKKYYDIEILTMGYSPNLKGKEKWMRINLPDIKLNGINLKEYRDKSHIHGENAILLDDKSSNLETFTGQKILFGKEHSWNKNWNGARLKNWKQVEEYLLLKHTTKKGGRLAF